MTIRLPVIQGNIKRRLLVNFRVEPSVIQRLLPEPFRPKLHAGFAIAGICLIRLEQIRPAGFPAFAGFSSENAAHRIAVVWNDSAGREQEGVFIPRRDTGSLLNSLAGDRIFPGEYHHAAFHVIDDGAHIDFTMKSRDGEVSIRVTGGPANELPATSCFNSLESASDFFRRRLPRILRHARPVALGRPFVAHIGVAGRSIECHRRSFQLL